MPDDKKKEADARPDAATKRRGVPAFALVAAGAIAGGAGVVFAVPPKVVEVPVAPVRHEMVDVLHPDVMQHEFNPRTKAGKAIARVALKFVYTVRDDREAAAFAKIKEHWELASSNVLLLLKQRSMEELQGDLQILEKDVLDELDATLFPGPKGEKVARVTRVIWTKWLFQ